MAWHFQDQQKHYIMYDQIVIWKKETPRLFQDISKCLQNYFGIVDSWIWKIWMAKVTKKCPLLWQSYNL